MVVRCTSLPHVGIGGVCKTNGRNRCRPALLRTRYFESEVLNLWIYFFIGTLPVPPRFMNVILTFALKGIDLSFTGSSLGENSEFWAQNFV